MLLKKYIRANFKLNKILKIKTVTLNQVNKNIEIFNKHSSQNEKTIQMINTKNQEINTVIIIFILNPRNDSKKLQVLAVSNGALSSLSQEILQIPTINCRCKEIRKQDMNCRNKLYQNGIVIKSSAY